MVKTIHKQLDDITNANHREVLAILVEMMLDEHFKDVTKWDMMKILEMNYSKFLDNPGSYGIPMRRSMKLYHIIKCLRS